MLGRLFSKLFSRKRAGLSGAGSRPVSPPPPAVPLATPPPPPPLPLQGYGSPAAPARPVPEYTDQIQDAVQPGPGPLVQPVSAAEGSVSAGEPVADPLDLSKPLNPEVQEAPPVASGEETLTSHEAASPGSVRLILEDGTLANPSLDPELEERLRYIVDNIVPPSDRPST